MGACIRSGRVSLFVTLAGLVAAFLIPGPTAAQPIVREGIDSRFEFLNVPAYRPGRFLEPTAQQWLLMQSALERCETRACEAARDRLTLKDFGFLEIDLNREGTGAHGFLLPRRGGNACFADGCFWLTYSGNSRNWGTIQSEIGYSRYLAVMNRRDGWAELRIDPRRDGPAFYYVPFRRSQGSYHRAENLADLERVKREIAQERESFATAQPNAMPILEGPPEGQGRTIRNHLGRVFPTLEYLPMVTNTTGVVLGGRFPELLERKVASDLNAGEGASRDVGQTARDGTSPTLRIASEPVPVAVFDTLGPDGYEGRPDIYQLRIFYKQTGNPRVVGEITPITQSGSQGTAGTLLSPAYKPLDPYNWAVSTHEITVPDYEAFGEANDPLEEVRLSLGVRDGEGAIFVEKIELWKLDYRKGDPLLTPSVP